MKQAEQKNEEQIPEQSTNQDFSFIRELIKGDLKRLLSPVAKTKPISPEKLNEELAKLERGVNANSLIPSFPKEIKLDSSKLIPTSLQMINVFFATLPVPGMGFGTVLTGRDFGQDEGIQMALNAVTQVIPQIVDEQNKEKVTKIEKSVKQLENSYEKELENLKSQLEEKEKIIISLKKELKELKYTVSEQKKQYLEELKEAIQSQNTQ